MRLIAALLTTLAVAVCAAPADAASRLVVRGAGFGHGVGMSQYGAKGFADHGSTYDAILAHYYTGTQLGALGGPTEVRVLLGNASSARFRGATRVAGERALDPAVAYRVVSVGGGRVELRGAGGRAVATYLAPLRVENAAGAPITLLGRNANGVRDGAYRGALEFRPGASGLLAVNAVDLESYLRGVVPAESPASWPAEALKAQAVAARTYAIATRKPVTGFDQYADTRSQVYLGVGAEKPASDAAVAATAGRIVTYAGKPVVTYFFSTSGGHTENVENSFIGSTPSPWLRGVDDPYDAESPKHRWGPYRWTFTQAKRKLGSWVKGTFRAVRVQTRGSSPRVVKAQVVGTRGTTEVTGPQLRSRLGLFDSWIYFTSVSTNAGSAPTTPSTPPTSTTPSPTTGSGGGLAPSAGAASVVVGSVSGRIDPAPAGGWVKLQHRTAAGWQDVLDVQVGPHGRYAARVQEPGTYRVRSGSVLGPDVVVR